MPGWRVAGLSAGLLGVLALTAVVVSLSGLSKTELAQTAAKKAAALPAVPGLGTQPVDQAETKKLFSYLAADSYTPQNEKSYLANRLGVDGATQNAPALKARQMMKGKVPVKEEKEPNYDVAYFSKFLLPPPPHYTRGGMHAAAAQAEKARSDAGLVDDDGVHYLGEANGKKLAKDLEDEEQKYLLSENHGIVWQSAAEEQKFKAESEHKAMKKMPPVKHLDKAQDKVLARDLEAGIAYATLPNHGVPVKEPRVQAKSKYTGFVTGAAGKKLAEELVTGEQEALAFEAAEAMREEKVGKARRHVIPYEVRGSHEARSSEAKKPISAVNKAKVAAGKMAKGVVESQVKKPQRAAPRVMAARQRKLQQLMRVPAHPKVDYLTRAQDRNVAEYLSKGIKEVWPAPKKVQHKYLSKYAGEKLVRAAKQDEKAEEKLWAPPTQRFVARKNGMRLAMEMEKSLKQENRAGGTFVDKYLHRVTGSKLHGRQGPRYVMSGSNEGEKWYNEQLSSRLEKGLGWEHKQQARKYRQEHEKYLNPHQMQALRDYMQPAVRVGKGVAPGLGFAV